jgi:hypothetical protein
MKTKFSVKKHDSDRTKDLGPGFSIKRLPQGRKLPTFDWNPQFLSQTSILSVNFCALENVILYMEINGYIDSVFDKNRFLLPTKKNLKNLIGRSFFCWLNLSLWYKIKYGTVKLFLLLLFSFLKLNGYCYSFKLKRLSCSHY